MIDKLSPCLQCLCTGFPDLSNTHDQVQDTFYEGQLNDNDTRHLASIQAHNAAGWGSTNLQIVQEGTVDHLGTQGDSGSDPLVSPSTTIADNSPSLSDDEFYAQHRVQDDNPRATSSSRRQMEGVAQSQAVTQGQGAAEQEASQRRQRKKEKDRIRKEADRAVDDQAYSRVCKLLAVRLVPKKTRSQRSECFSINHVGGVKRFVVLKGVESIDQDFERICELLEISMTPRQTLAHRSECLCIHFCRTY